MAMMDTMGQAQSMTGGYGNSWAQSVGQQAYQGELQKLNEVIPELYQLALDQHNREGDAMYDQASLLAGMEEQDYGRYRDQVSDYYTELDRLTNDSRYQAEQDYGKWADNQSFGYQQYRDQVADQQWQAQFDEAKRQYDEKMALTQSKSSNGGDKPYTPPKYTANPGWDAATIKAFQEAHGLKVDGSWGPETAAAYDKAPNWKPDGGGITGFTGKTRSEAVAYAKLKGVPSANASSILTKQEFSHAKAVGSNRSNASDFDTYEEYLQYMVDALIAAYGK